MKFHPGPEHHMILAGIPALLLVIFMVFAMYQVLPDMQFTYLLFAIFIGACLLASFYDFCSKSRNFLPFLEKVLKAKTQFISTM